MPDINQVGPSAGINQKSDVAMSEKTGFFNNKKCKEVGSSGPGCLSGIKKRVSSFFGSKKITNRSAKVAPAETFISEKNKSRSSKVAPAETSISQKSKSRSSKVAPAETSVSQKSSKQNIIQETVQTNESRSAYKAILPIAMTDEQREECAGVLFEASSYANDSDRKFNSIQLLISSGSENNLNLAKQELRKKDNDLTFDQHKELTDKFNNKVNNLNGMLGGGNKSASTRKSLFIQSMSLAEQKEHLAEKPVSMTLDIQAAYTEDTDQHFEKISNLIENGTFESLSEARSRLLGSDNSLTPEQYSNLVDRFNDKAKEDKQIALSDEVMAELIHKPNKTPGYRQVKQDELNRLKAMIQNDPAEFKDFIDDAMSDSLKVSTRQLNILIEAYNKKVG